MIGDYNLYDLNPFMFIETCFMAHNVVYLGICSSAPENNVSSVVEYCCVLCCLHQIDS